MPDAVGQPLQLLQVVVGLLEVAALGAGPETEPRGVAPEHRVTERVRQLQGFFCLNPAFVDGRGDVEGGKAQRQHPGEGRLVADPSSHVQRMVGEEPAALPVAAVGGLDRLGRQ